jgi:hypothetical protein
MERNELNSLERETGYISSSHWERPSLCGIERRNPYARRGFVIKTIVGGGLVYLAVCAIASIFSKKETPEEKNKENKLKRKTESQIILGGKDSWR